MSSRFEIIGVSANTKGRLGMTPLMCAAASDMYKEVNELLVRNSEVDTRDNRGNTALHWSLKIRRLDNEVIKLLLSYGADVNIQNVDLETPLHMAASSGSGETVQILLLAGADASIVNAKGEVPADIAVDDAYDILSVERSDRERAILRRSAGIEDQEQGPAPRRRL